MDRIRKEDYRSLIIAYLILTALLYLGIFVPLALVAVPFILVWAVARAGAMAGGIAAVLSFAAAAYTDYGAALVFAAAFLPVAFAAGYMIRAKKRFRDSVVVSIAAVFAGALLVTGMSFLAGSSPVDYIVDYTGGSIKELDAEQINLLYQMVRYPDIVTGAITREAVLATQAAEAVQIMQNMVRDTLDLWLVTIIGLYSLLLGLLCCTIPRAVLKKSMEVAPAPDFSDYALPKRFWLAFAASWFFAAAGNSFGWQSFDIVGITVFNLYAFVFTVQALCFLDFMYKKRKMGAVARALLHVITAVVLSYALIFIGVIENVFGIRKRMDSLGTPKSL